MALPIARTRGSAWAEANARILLEAVEGGAELQEETPDARTLELSRRLAARLLRWRRRSSPGDRASAQASPMVAGG
jgi:hypothetical protein